jgi:hypothetical protein
MKGMLAAVLSPGPDTETEGNIRIGSSPSPDITDDPSCGRHVFATAIRRGLGTASSLITRT